MPVLVISKFDQVPINISVDMLMKTCVFNLLRASNSEKNIKTWPKFKLV